jgi:hypothetical protein
MGARGGLRRHRDRAKPFGSQNDEAGTRQRRSRNDGLQNELVKILSSRIDNQRIAAVATLEALGDTFSAGDGGTPPSNTSDIATQPSTAETDLMHVSSCAALTPFPVSLGAHRKRLSSQVSLMRSRGEVLAGRQSARRQGLTYVSLTRRGSDRKTRLPNPISVQ